MSEDNDQVRTVQLREAHHHLGRLLDDVRYNQRVVRLQDAVRRTTVAYLVHPDMYERFEQVRDLLHEYSAEHGIDDPEEAVRKIVEYFAEFFDKFQRDLIRLKENATMGDSHE